MDFRFMRLGRPGSSVFEDEEIRLVVFDQCFYIRVGRMNERA
jgi:hypothetical protein